MRYFPLIFLSWTVAVQGEPGAVEVLRRAADAAARAGELYEMQVRVSRSYNDEDPRVPGATEFTLWRSGNRFRYEGGINRNSPTFRHVSDGTWVWNHQPNWGQYTEDRTDAAQGELRLAAVRDADFKFRRRFEMLAKMNVDATREGTEVVKTRDGEHKCDIVRCSPSDPKERSWDERLWVDASTGLVRKSVMNRRVIDDNRPRQQTEIVVWEHIALGGPIADSAFQFTPPKGARLVEKFRAPQQAPLPMPN